MVLHDVKMACERISRKNPNSIICCKNYYINFSVMKADDEIKVRRRIFTLKTLIYVEHIMRVLGFSLILLFSILFSVSNRFLLLQIAEVYNEEKQIEYSVRL